MKDIPSKLSKEVEEKYRVESNTFIRDVKDSPKDKITVEVGDSKQPDFKPQFKVARWENECNFSMRAQEHPDAVVEVDKDVIKYKTPDYEVHQYDKPEAAEYGGFEFEWVLPKKPESNVLTATIQTKGLNFFYQPALTEEEIAEGSVRPDNVTGSYAVYHATKGGMNRADGMEYKTGKAFHIYRPEAVDANGERVWCELNIDTDNGLLTVTVPQEFLESASYPLVVDPTFGITGIGGSSLASLGSSTSKIASVSGAFVAATGDTITSYSLYATSTASSNTMLMTAYTVVAGVVSARLAVASNVTVTNVAGWRTSGAVSQALTNSTGYCTAIGFGSQSAGETLTIRYDNGSAPGRFGSTAVAMNDPFSPSGTDSGRQYSWYSTYTSGGSSASSSPSTSPSSSASSSPSPSSSPSNSPSASPSPSSSPSSSVSTSASNSPSTSVSSSVSSSISNSPSTSPSSSLSPSSSPSTSTSSSVSTSVSTSPSASPSASPSPSSSPSSSVSNSASSSVSSSTSNSPSTSPSTSPSAPPSSPSASPSTSVSNSVSSSPSTSPSASPYGGVVKRWNGSAWVRASIKVNLV